MQDKTNDNALLALRKQIIRGDGDGLAHVEALLVQRGVHMTAVLPAKSKDVAGKGMMSLLVISALKHGPKRLPAIAALVDAARPEISHDAAYVRTTQTLDRLKRKGVVVQDFGPDGCLWKIRLIP